MNTELTFEPEPFDFSKQALDTFFEEDAFEFLDEVHGSDTKKTLGPNSDVFRSAVKGTVPLKRSGVGLHRGREIPGGTIKAATQSPFAARRSKPVQASPPWQPLLAQTGLTRATRASPGNRPGAGAQVRTKELTSPRFEGDQILSACFHNKARLGEGASGPAVLKIQSALKILGYDLGPTGTDGKFGPTTAAAVRAFKRREWLGFEQYGDVGPGTMHRLDRIFAGETSFRKPVTSSAVVSQNAGEPFVVAPLAPAAALQIPPDEGDCPPISVAAAFTTSRPVSSPRGLIGDPCLLAPAPPGAISDFEADLRKNPGRIMGVVIDPQNPNEIIGYRVRTDSSILRIVDREGNFVDGNEKSLDQPMLDPIDFIPTPGAVVKGATVIGKVGLKVLGKLVAKEVTTKATWKMSVLTIPRLRNISANMLARFARAKAKDVPNIALRVTEDAVEGSFDRHAAQWFGRTVDKSTHLRAWRELIELANQSKRVFPWSDREVKTVAKLVTIGETPFAKRFVVQFAADDGRLVTAFVPDQRQLEDMRFALKLMK